MLSCIQGLFGFVMWRTLSGSLVILAKLEDE